MVNNSKVFIKTEYITLGAFLKFAGITQTGGEAKRFLDFHLVKVNDQPIASRGYKIFRGDSVTIETDKYLILEDYE
ncbi:MAG: RNA-binding S4 domain-containing protein [Acholeplasmatales bacterium]|jgi:ribosome-associated protein YbcJ (S4-like RNA binding protein)|nr:RNA-binding S4 domain-containing protein [Acholeplasmatales bacterium]